MELCRFGTMCWRALCPYVHACSRTRARKCAETWRLLSEMEEEESLVEIPQVQHIVVDGPVVQTVQDPTAVLGQDRRHACGGALRDGGRCSRGSNGAGSA